MKKYILTMMAVLFLVACSSKDFINVSMPNFKPLASIKAQDVHSGIRVFLQPVRIEQNNNYSDYFENSILKIRIDKEIELLKQNLEEQIRAIAKSKGYEIGNANARYKLESVVNVHIEERNVQKTSNWLSGDSVSSNLGLSFEAKVVFVDTYNPQNATHMKSNAKLDSYVDLKYPIKSDNGIGVFKTTLSTVPTQLNKGLEDSAFEIDKSFLSFYKTTLNTLYENFPQASSVSTQGYEKFNEFINDESFNDHPNKSQDTQKSSQSSEDEQDGVVIFE